MRKEKKKREEEEKKASHKTERVAHSYSYFSYTFYIFKNLLFIIYV